jgi:hypothetical protein
VKDFFNFIYMRNKGFIFVYNPKVACTNWKCILRYLNGAEDYLRPAVAHNRQESGLQFLSDDISAKSIVHDVNIPKYAFVRSPFSRILSAYLNKIEPYTEGRRDENDDNPYFHSVFCEIDKHRMDFLPEESSVNFYCFLHWLSNVDNFHTQNEHWLPQVELLRIPEVKYEFIGKLEALNKDAPKLLGLIECDIDFPSQQKVGFAPTNATDKLMQYYSSREIDVAKELYSIDFEVLGYDTNLVINKAYVC